MSHEERQLLDEALVRTYNTKGITHDNASLEDPAQPGQYREMPVLGDLYEILKTSKETMRMAHILNRLVNGSASTFNKQTNVRLDNKYTVLDISSLTGDLLTVGMFVALDFVWDRAKADRTEEKAIFIDECWQLVHASEETGVPVNVSPTALENVVLGCAKVLEANALSGSFYPVPVLLV